MEKCKVRHIRPQNIKVEYKSSNKEIKKVNEKCDLGVDFDDTFKVSKSYYVSCVENK